jgi:hypothetical protein
MVGLRNIQTKNKKSIPKVIQVSVCFNGCAVRMGQKRTPHIYQRDA